jgi:P27 family predicted phage terminase small subunit
MSRKLPANVHRLRGNPSKLSKRELEQRERDEIKPRLVAVKAPADLSPLERECWDLHAAELDHLSLLTVLDIAAFRLLVCGPYEMARAARELLRPRKADGTPDRRRTGLELLHVDGDTLRTHPAYRIWRQSIEAYRMGCREFGLTPSSRVSLRPGAAVGTVPDDDEDDDLFFGTR